MIFAVVYFVGFIAAWFLFAWCESLSSSSASGDMAWFALIWPLAVPLFILVFAYILLEMMFKATVKWLKGEG